MKKLKAGDVYMVINTPFLVGEIILITEEFGNGLIKGQCEETPLKPCYTFLSRELIKIGEL